MQDWTAQAIWHLRQYHILPPHQMLLSISMHVNMHTLVPCIRVKASAHTFTSTSTSTPSSTVYPPQQVHTLSLSYASKLAAGRMLGAKELCSQPFRSSSSGRRGGRKPLNLLLAWSRSKQMLTLQESKWEDNEAGAGLLSFSWSQCFGQPHVCAAPDGKFTARLVGQRPLG